MSPNAIPDITYRDSMVSGFSLRYAIAGSGDPVVLLHGGFQTSREWMAAIPALAERYTVIAPDLRGLGDSGRPETGYDMATVAGDVRELLRQLGHERILLAGHDLGAAIAYVYTATYGNVRGLAFLEMLLPGFGFEEAWVPRPGGQWLWFAALNSVPGVAETLFADRDSVAAYFRLILRGGFAARSNAVSDEDFDEYVRCYSAPGAIRALGEYFRAMWMNSEKVRALALSPILTPVLAMGGAQSVGAGAAASMRAVAKNVEGVVIPGAGHWLNDEAPGEVSEHLVRFFHSVASRP